MIGWYMSLAFEHSRNMNTLGQLPIYVIPVETVFMDVQPSRRKCQFEIRILSPLILFVRIHYDFFFFKYVHNKGSYRNDWHAKNFVLPFQNVSPSQNAMAQQSNSDCRVTLLRCDEHHGALNESPKNEVFFLINQIIFFLENSLYS